MPRGYRDEDNPDGFEGTEAEIVCLDCGYQGAPRIVERQPTCKKCNSANVEEIE